MAKGKKTGGRDYSKGHSMGGRKPLPPEIKELSNATKPEIIVAYWKISHLTTKEIKEIKISKLSLLEQGILNTMKKFASTGSTGDIARIWAECHGKPIEYKDFKGDVSAKIIVEYVDKPAAE